MGIKEKKKVACHFLNIFIKRHTFYRDFFSIKKKVPHYIDRVRLTTYAAGKISTVVILGLRTAESLRLRRGQLLVKTYA